MDYKIFYTSWMGSDSNEFLTALINTDKEITNYDEFDKRMNKFKNKYGTFNGIQDFTIISVLESLGYKAKLITFRSISL